ncbi:MAG: 6,7-dimethyl-8-ribityllumazine synthase [Planctomycetes bacterium]|nr:6,7-dimethyl-8-ribityllumazine synthase [Planctomycetota bacterium]
MATDSGKDARPRLQRPGAKIAFVVSTFHHELTSAMHASAVRELVASGLSEADLPMVTVPGAFELPIVARRFARRPEIDAVICLGVVLKGETTHDVYVAQGATDGIRQVMLETDTPVLLGVLTCNTVEQARARALAPEDGGVQDKGRELAAGAIEVLAALDAALDPDQRPLGF